MWSPSHRSNNRRVETQARQLVRDCESFLLGRYPWVLQAKGYPVPEWAWLSAVEALGRLGLMARAPSSSYKPRKPNARAWHNPPSVARCSPSAIVPVKSSRSRRAARRKSSSARSGSPHRASSEA